MAATYEIEREPPDAFTCECCGGLSVRLTRFVHRDRAAFAVYLAIYSNDHPDNEIAMVVSIGEWGEDSNPSTRVAFYCCVRPTEKSYEVMLRDMADSPWSTSSTLGERLSREAALRHPWKAAAFEVLDAGFAEDPSLRGFMKRVECGSAAVPLETSFHAPDVIADIAESAKKKRVVLERNLASLDGKRGFVRCLLRIPVKSYGYWSIGIWVEVSMADLQLVASVWENANAYAALKISGKLANKVSPDLGLPIPEGASVRVIATDPDELLCIDPRVGPLESLLSTTWSKPQFEAFATSRGFL